MTKKTIRNLGTMVLLWSVLFRPDVFAMDVYEFDPVHSSVQFRIKHLAISNVYGNFSNFNGTIEVDPDNPANNSIRAYVTVQSINTNTARRDDHLRSPDFFDSSQYPKVTFQSTSWKKIESDVFEVSGNLTLHGVTQPLTVRLVQTGAGKDPWGGYRIGFETTFVINRQSFKMGKMNDTVGGEVNITVSIEAVKKK